MPLDLSGLTSNDFGYGVDAPWTADQLNEKFDTTCGQRVLDLLAPYHATKPTLQPPLPDLHERVVEASREFKFPYTRVQTVSYQDPEAGLTEINRNLPPGMWTVLGQLTPESLMPVLLADLSYRFRDTPPFATILNAYDLDMWTRMMAAVHDDLWHTSWMNFVPCIGGGDWAWTVTNLATDCLWNLVTCQVALLLSGSPDAEEAVARIQPLIDIYHQGNLPFGEFRTRTPGDSLMVFVA